MKKSLVLFLLVISCYGAFSQRIISDTLLRTFTKHQLDTILSSNGIPAIFNTVYDIEVHKIIYHTVSYDSTPTYASGMLAIPKGVSCKSLPMASYDHGTEAAKDEAPSRLGGQEPVVGWIMASLGYVVTEPDYLGLGDGPGLHPYQHAQTEASATIDMMRSAREFCDSNGIHRNGQVFLMGYSEGGHACMATYRTMQEQLAGEFTVTAAVPMSGAYDMSGTMVNTMLSNAPYDQPGYLPYLILSWNPIYHIYDSIQQALVYPYDSTLPPLFDGTHGINDANAAMPSVPKLIFTSSELDTFINNLNSPFRLALKANDVYSWKPTSPTKILFCKADTYVPYLNSVVCIDSMRALGVGSNVDTLDINPLLGHVDCATYAILYAKTFFDNYMHIDDYPAAAVATQGSTVICHGDSVVLSTPGDPSYTYQWQVNGVNLPGATSATYTADSAGGYNVQTTLQNCTTTSNVLVVSHDSLPVIVSNGQTLFTSAGLFYQWYTTSGPVGGATQQSYTPAASGTYTVMVQDSNGCSQQSLAFSFTTGIASIAANNIHVYPNPAKDQLTIDGSFTGTIVSADMYDVDGKKVQTNTLHSGRNVISLSGLSAGVYALKITDVNNLTSMTKVIVE